MSGGLELQERGTGVGDLGGAQHAVAVRIQRRHERRHGRMSPTVWTSRRAILMLLGQTAKRAESKCYCDSNNVLHTSVLSRVAVAQPGPAARPPRLLLSGVGQPGLRGGGRREETVPRQGALPGNRAARTKHSALSQAATLREGTLRQREARIIFAGAPFLIAGPASAGAPSPKASASAGASGYSHRHRPWFPPSPREARAGRGDGHCLATLTYPLPTPSLWGEGTGNNLRLSRRPEAGNSSTPRGPSGKAASLGFILKRLVFLAPVPPHPSPLPKGEGALATAFFANS